MVRSGKQPSHPYNHLLQEKHMRAGIAFARQQHDRPILSADQQQKLVNFHGGRRQHGEEAMKSLDRFLRG